MMKVGLLLLTLLVVSPLCSVQAGDGYLSVDLSKLKTNPKDITWLQDLHGTPGKTSLKITIKTPRATEVVEGMFFQLRIRSGKVSYKDHGVITLSDDAMLEIRHLDKPNGKKVLKTKRFKGKWISYHSRKVNLTRR